MTRKVSGPLDTLSGSTTWVDVYGHRMSPEGSSTYPAWVHAPPAHTDDSAISKVLIRERITLASEIAFEVYDDE